MSAVLGCSLTSMVVRITEPTDPLHATKMHAQTKHVCEDACEIVGDAMGDGHMGCGAVVSGFTQEGVTN
jgi:hypothetical protein